MGNLNKVAHGSNKHDQKGVYTAGTLLPPPGVKPGVEAGRITPPNPYAPCYAAFYL